MCATTATAGLLMSMFTLALPLCSTLRVKVLTWLSTATANIDAKTDKSSRAVIIGATQKGKIQYIKLNIYVDNTTGIEGVIVENGKTVESRQYVNVAGQVSDRPFRGVNILVTRYTDGSTRSAKAVF